MDGFICFISDWDLPTVTDIRQIETQTGQILKRDIVKHSPITMTAAERIVVDKVWILSA
jgi:hypothetical protein